MKPVICPVNYQVSPKVVLVLGCKPAILLALKKIMEEKQS
jgi:hypothetical protein